MAHGTIVATPLDAGAFVPFGSVLDIAALPGRPVNENRGLRFDLPVGLDHDTGASSPSTAVYRLTASNLPFAIRQFERHHLSDQLFVPLAASACLVAVAPAGRDGRPDIAGIRAFIGLPGQAIVYGAGVWHLPLVALDGEGTFLMQMWEIGDAGRDCEVQDLPDPVMITR
jgi:ureidoglycolate hydrolase